MSFLWVEKGDAKVDKNLKNQIIQNAVKSVHKGKFKSVNTYVVKER